MRQSAGTSRLAPSGDTIAIVKICRGFCKSDNPWIDTVSAPVRPRDCHVVPGSNISGATPIPTRLER